MFTNKKFLKTHAIITGLTLIFLSVSSLGEDVSAQSSLPILENPETYFKTLASLKYSTPNIEQDILRVREKYVVIFIPGILGSKLTDPQKGTIWGEKPEPDLESLILSKDSPYATTKIMREYPGLWIREDIYGKFDSALKVLAAGTAKTMEFPYDWRQDLNVVTEKLDEFIRAKESQLRGKHVIIIAHSMGGLVFFNWKNKFFENEKKIFEYPFYLYRAFLLGSPLKGSCDILRMLLTGYRPVPDAGVLETIGYNYLFSDVQGALFTFPSIFQLIPLYDEKSPKKSCLIFRTPIGDLPKNPFSIDVWKILSAVDDIKTLWNRIGLSLEDFEILLKTAEDFRIDLNDNLRENRLQGRFLYFYNDTRKTTEQVVVKFSDDFTDPEVIKDDSTIPKRGDGRVLFESATNAGEPGMSRHFLQSGHGDLVKDDAFFAFLKTNLSQDIYGLMLKEIAPLTLKDSHATQQLARTGKVLALSALGEDPTKPNEFHEGTKAVLQLNLRAVEALTTDEKFMETQPSFSRVSDLGKRAYEYAKYLDDTLHENTRAIPLYEIAMASGKLKRNVDKVYSLNRYGYALLKDKRFQEAERALSSARNNFEVSSTGFTKDFAGKLYNNLGNVYLRTNKTSDAIASLQKAAEFGSMKAVLTLRSMEERI